MLRISRSVQIDIMTLFRALAARADDLSADIPDCQYAAKEIRRWMGSPTELSRLALKRLGRYLLGRPILVSGMLFQSAGAVDPEGFAHSAAAAGEQRTHPS